MWAAHLLRICIKGPVCARKGRMDTLLGLHLGAWHMGVLWQVLDMRGAIVPHLLKPLRALASKTGLLSKQPEMPLWDIRLHLN